MITFKNGTSFETEAIFQGTGRYQGAERSFIEIRVNADTISFENLREIYMNEDALSEITITDDAGSKMLLTDYTIRAQISEMKSQSGDKEITLLTMKIAQKTQVEIEQAKQAQEIDEVKSLLEINA